MSGSESKPAPKRRRAARTDAPREGHDTRQVDLVEMLGASSAPAAAATTTAAPEAAAAPARPRKRAKAAAATTTAAAAAGATPKRSRKASATLEPDAPAKATKPARRRRSSTSSVAPVAKPTAPKKSTEARPAAAAPASEPTPERPASTPAPGSLAARLGIAPPGSAGSESREPVREAMPPAPSYPRPIQRDPPARPRIAPAGSAARGDAAPPRPAIAPPGSAGRGEAAPPRPLIAPPGSAGRGDAAPAARPMIAPPGSAGRAAGGGARPSIAPPGSAGQARPAPAKPQPAETQSAEPVAPSTPNAASASAPRVDDPPRRAGLREPSRPRIAPAGSASRADAETPRQDAVAGAADAAVARIDAPPALRAPTVDARTRRQRFAEPAAAAPPACGPDLPAIAPRLALVLVTRNHASRLAAAVAGWRHVLPAFDLRLAVLDLGSVDGTVALAESERLEVIAAPGGLAKPVEALLQAASAAPGELILLADADAAPTASAQALVDAVRGGAAMVAAGGRRPGLMALDRRRLPSREKTPSPPAPGSGPSGFEHWLQEAGLALTTVASAELDRDDGFVGRLVDRRRRRGLRDRAMRWLGRWR